MCEFACACAIKHVRFAPLMFELALHVIEHRSDCVRGCGELCKHSMAAIALCWPGIAQARNVC